jgi:RNA polymerase sigma factor (sigma-70 family)
VQTAWFRLVERLGTLRDPAQVGAWLATTTRRECLRQAKRAQRVVVTDAFIDLASEERADEGIDRSERDEALWAAFERLSEACRVLLRMLMADPPPAYADVSAALDMPIGSIGPTRGRCLKRLRTHLRARGISDGPTDSG